MQSRLVGIFIPREATQVSPPAKKFHKPLYLRAKQKNSIYFLCVEFDKLTESPHLRIVFIVMFLHAENPLSLGKIIKNQRRR